MSTASVFSASILIHLAVGVVMLAGGIVLLIHAKSKRREEEHSVGAAVRSAQISDLRITKPAGYYVTEMALIYTGTDGMQHRAFLSVSNSAPLNVQIGSQLSVVVFPTPLTMTPQEAFDPMRGADGRLPEHVIPASVQSIPLDETGTVMLSADYPRWQTQAAHGSRGAWIAGIILTAIGAVRMLSLVGSLINLLRFRALF